MVVICKSEKLFGKQSNKTDSTSSRLTAASGRRDKAQDIKHSSGKSSIESVHAHGDSNSGMTFASMLTVPQHELSRHLTIY